MSYRRRLIIAAIAGSACWIGYWVWYYSSTCSLITMSGGRAITCRWESAEPGGTTLVSQTAPALPVFWTMVSKTVGVPALVVVAGAVVLVLIERFRGRT
jgi:hypothetical protein